MSTPRHGPRPAPPQETRAEIARRRLAQLAASFEATHDEDPFDRLVGPAQDATGPATDVVDRALQGPAQAPVPARGRRRADVGPRAGLSAVHLRVVATAAVAAGVLLTWWLLAERPRTSDVDRPLEVSARADPTGGPAPDGTAESGGRVVVDVAGQVRRPGIVTLPAGSRVHEAIERAGDIKGALDQPTLNLARVLVDGEQLLVGVDPPAAAVAGPGAGGTGGPGVAVNLNTATLEELDALPGVGPVTAQAILDWRTENGRFTSVDDLLDVAGIGEKTLEDLRDRVSV
ncbi:helix-hairpin-helix domain-containing protein [Aeromicrobium sp.]|uniref:helix-hairpin-helix domain-containing protein n=1 Tax=Aeromicrobium sp. TaxID=1871063 RepID=UPI00351857D7